MEIALVMISIFCIALLIYLLGIKLQLRSIWSQLEYRNREQSVSPVLLEINDKDINRLTVALNKALRQEAQLRMSQEIREQEFRDLITNISHDLRTPLTVMKGYLQLLERCELEKVPMRYLNICFRHTDELEKRVQQFFEYSYWANQKECISLHTVNITNLVTDAMTDFIPVFEEKGISMRLENDTIYKGIGEEELLKRVMQNILKNCLKYATGEVVVSIEKWADGQSSFNGRLKICITNPVPENCSVDADKVFDRFYVGSTERNQSSGLGLSIVKLLVEKMQGEVFAGREDGVFYVGFFICADR